MKALIGAEDIASVQPVAHTKTGRWNYREIEELMMAQKVQSKMAKVLRQACKLEHQVRIAVKAGEVLRKKVMRNTASLGPVLQTVHSVAIKFKKYRIHNNWYYLM